MIDPSRLLGGGQGAVRVAVGWNFLLPAGAEGLDCSIEVGLVVLLKVALKGAAYPLR